MPRFGHEPKFKPEPGRTGPRSSVRKFSSVAKLVQWSSLEFRGWQYFAEPVWTRLNWTLLWCQNIFSSSDTLCCLPFWRDFVDHFLISCVWLHAAIVDHIAYSQLTPSDVVSASIIKIVGALTNNLQIQFGPETFFGHVSNLPPLCNNRSTTDKGIYWPSLALITDM